MKKPIFDEETIKREFLIDRYVQGLDSGDADAIAEVLAESLSDPELDRLITEINLAYQEEEQLTPLEEENPFVPMREEAERVRNLLPTHLTSAFESQVESSRLLTVGEVAAQLKRRVPFPDQEVNESLLNSSVPMPQYLSLQAVKKLAQELGIKASDRFWRLFHNEAIALCMARSQSQAQLAARKQSARSRSKARKSSPSTGTETSKKERD